VRPHPLPELAAGDRRIRARGAATEEGLGNRAEPEAVMTPQLLELLQAVLRDGWWVPLETYLAAYPGETQKAVYNRRSKGGVWIDGVHSKFVKGGGLWINLMAVNAWVAKSELRLVSPSEKTVAGSRSASGSPSCSAESSAANDSDSPPPPRTSDMP
jgi:hypothetical protein